MLRGRPQRPWREALKVTAEKRADSHLQFVTVKGFKKVCRPKAWLFLAGGQILGLAEHGNVRLVGLSRIIATDVWNFDLFVS
jgi:hypothetical protein